MEFIDYDVANYVTVITLNRPQKANAQNIPLLVELNDCWQQASADSEVRVIIVQANGRHFSAGHDLSGGRARAPKDGDAARSPRHMADVYSSEAEYFLGYSMAWRNISKP